MPDNPKEKCSVCGAEDRKNCRNLEDLGTRSLMAKRQGVCPVCGGDYALIVWTGKFKMCELCAQNKDQAVRILKHKHKNRLRQILAKLDQENTG